LALSLRFRRLHPPHEIVGTDPLIYELVLVNGPAWKALIEEEFGDGIMSAIDFDMTIDRQSDPKGDRVKIAMTRSSCPSSITTRPGMRSKMGTRRYRGVRLLAEYVGCAERDLSS
jgi:cyanate lyase-like protein